jgi:TATA-box binding protein (TBP) (component of TFIID and TFIIIB)
MIKIMITNINYRGCLPSNELKNIKFHDLKAPPHQKIFTLRKNIKLLVFPSGKCRLMGLRKPLNEKETILPFVINDLKIQSITVVYDFGCTINLLTLSRQIRPQRRCLFEPELFPALRLLEFNPLCVNVFSSGKVVILGLKKLSYQNILRQIIWRLNEYLKR